MKISLYRNKRIKFSNILGLIVFLLFVALFIPHTLGIYEDHNIFINNIKDDNLEKLQKEITELKKIIEQQNKIIERQEKKILELRIALLELEKKSSIEENDKTNLFFPFIDNGDGTIIDTRSNIMWDKRGGLKPVTYAEALEYCHNSKLGGYNDWRIPEIEELSSLYNSLGMMTGYKATEIKDRTIAPFEWAGKHYWSGTLADKNTPTFTIKYIYIFAGNLGPGKRVISSRDDPPVKKKYIPLDERVITPHESEVRQYGNRSWIRPVRSLKKQQ